VVGFWQMDLAVVGFLANGGSCNNRKERRSKAKVLNSALHFPSLLELGKAAAAAAEQAHHLTTDKWPATEGSH